MVNCIFKNMVTC